VDVDVHEARGDGESAVVGHLRSDERGESGQTLGRSWNFGRRDKT